MSSPNCYVHADSRGRMRRALMARPRLRFRIGKEFAKLSKTEDQLAVTSLKLIVSVAIEKSGAAPPD
jgi:hypothetical protein